ncbi:zinc metallopeptidase [Dethiobacter alkaliphilus]|uniref:zinc metallopeptidase n=1 Tax=Dethiobacter alkaliphilus TaxID=427926 RepID=UPI002225EEF3|nr:zinc metallopeptidase [Dethiobacter alkaliphilus]MCW3491578.1 zinc metallopeptidase [Dethiobacter alkaliphilus]
MILPDFTWLLILPAMLFAMLAQSKVKAAYQKYSRVRARSGVTGAQAARNMLDTAGLYHIKVKMGHGELTDHYDPRNGVVSLSPGVYQSNSVAALGIAAHEAGHALQHSEGYLPLSFRNNIFPLANLGSRMAMPLFFIGFIFSVQGTNSVFMNVGIMLFAFAVLFHIVTLPVEFNASSRAVKLLESGGFIARDEVGGTRQVLSAAALTYLASAAVALTQLVRLLILRDRRR